MRIHTSGPAINIHHDVLDQHVPSKVRKHDSPNHPVQPANGKDTNGHHTMEIVRQAMIFAFARIWRYVRRNNQVDVRQEEKDRNGKRGPNSWCPIWEIPLPCQVDVDKATRYEDIDDG